MDPILSSLITILSSGFRRATPLIYAATGETLTERSGIINLGNEGCMLMGALTGFITAYFIGDLWLALLVAMATGGAMALVMAFLSISLRASQVIAGITIWLLGLGLSGFFFRMIFGISPQYPTISGFDKISIPLLSQLPVIGEILFQHDILVYLAFIIAPIFTFIIFRTTFGLKVTSVGENPLAAETMGLNVYMLRYICVVIGGLFAGLGGAYLSLASVSTFTDNITMGRGWIAIVTVHFGKWNPSLAMLGALLFGVVDALQLQISLLLNIPNQLLRTLPYLIVILIQLRVFKRGMPAALAIPYKRLR